MISTTLDITAQLNQNSAYIINMGGCNSVTIQVVGAPSGAIAFQGSNDQVVGNFTTIQANNLSTGVAASTTSAAGMFQIIGAFGYLRLSGTALAVTKVLVFINKIN